MSSSPNSSQNKNLEARQLPRRHATLAKDLIASLDTTKNTLGWAGQREENKSANKWLVSCAAARSEVGKYHSSGGCDFGFDTSSSLLLLHSNLVQFHVYSSRQMEAYRRDRLIRVHPPSCYTWKITASLAPYIVDVVQLLFCPRPVRIDIEYVNINFSQPSSIF